MRHVRKKSRAASSSERLLSVTFVILLLFLKVEDFIEAVVFKRLHRCFFCITCGCTEKNVLQKIGAK